MGEDHIQEYNWEIRSSCCSAPLQDSSLSEWLSLGAPAEKLLMGFPTYGRTYRLTTPNHSLGAPAKGPADAGPYTRTAGFWAYYEVRN